ERPFRVAADEAKGVAVALRDRAGDHGPVGGEAPAAADLLLLQQRSFVGFLVFQRLGVEDRPVGREPDQDAEEDDDEGEEFDDLPVHCAPSVRFGSTASRRARSEIKSSRATRTKLATTELPP